MARRRARKSNNVPQVSMAQLSGLLRGLEVSKKRPAKRRARRGRATLAREVENEGTIVLTRSELLTTVTLAANNTESLSHYEINPATLSFLKGVANAFERSKWHVLEFWYKPAVGTTYGGLVVFGVDWDFSGTAKSRADIAAYTPSYSCAAWSDSQTRPMRLPAGRLQSRMWFQHRASALVDKGPCRLWVGVSGQNTSSNTTVGEIWVRYRVELMGTSPS